MYSLNSLQLAELRQDELRADAARVRLARRARLAAKARRARRHAATAPAAVTPLARSLPFDELATRFAAEGSAAVRDELNRFVVLAAARGVTPTLLSILADDDQPDVARQRALGRIVAKLTSPVRGSADEASGTSDAA
jgi:hypothetical protein